MLKRRIEDVEGNPVAMDGAHDVTMRMLVGRADGAPNFSMRHFTVEPGGHTPRHEHNYEHEVIITHGEGRVEHGGDLHDIRAGDVLYVAPNTVHQFTNPSSAPMSFICLVPSSFDCSTGERLETPGS